MSKKSLSGASGQGLAIGAAIGMIFGQMLNQLVWGLIIGASIGLIFGSALEYTGQEASVVSTMNGDE